MICLARGARSAICPPARRCSHEVQLVRCRVQRCMDPRGIHTLRRPAPCWVLMLRSSQTAHVTRSLLCATHLLLSVLVHTCSSHASTTQEMLTCTFFDIHVRQADRHDRRRRLRRNSPSCSGRPKSTLFAPLRTRARDKQPRTEPPKRTTRRPQRRRMGAASSNTATGSRNGRCLPSALAASPQDSRWTPHNRQTHAKPAQDGRKFRNVCRGVRHVVAVARHNVPVTEGFSAASHRHLNYRLRRAWGARVRESASRLPTAMHLPR